MLFYRTKKSRKFCPVKFQQIYLDPLLISVPGSALFKQAFIHSIYYAIKG